MTDLVLETLRTGVLLILVLYLIRAGRSRAELCLSGWRFLLAGFALVLFGSAIDITDNFQSLNHFVVIGDTPTQAFLEKMVGFLGGFLLVTIGLIRWIPTLSSIHRTDNLLAQLARANDRLLANESRLLAQAEKQRATEETIRSQNLELSQSRANALRMMKETELATKKIAAALATTETILDASPVGILVLGPDQKIRRVNQAALEIMGHLSSNDIIGTTYQERTPRRHGGIDNASELGKSASSSERILIRADGKEIPILKTVVPIILNDEKVQLEAFIDISDRKQAETEMRKLSTAIEQSPVTVIITDLDGKIQYVNPKFMEITGYTAEEVIGRNPRILRSGDLSTDEYQQLWKTIRAGEVWRGEFHNRKKNGELYWEAASISPIRDSEGRITNFLAGKEDITERKKAEQQLEITATTDKLTGLHNRDVFLDKVNQALSQAKRNENRFALLFLDLDRFKVVNDSLGHDVGDALLCAVAEIFRRELRETDLIARIGGDEFVMLLTNLDQWSDARLKAEKLLKLLAEPHTLEGHQVVSTASIGLVTNERSYQTAGEMIRDADAAMYQAKDAGKGRVVVFGPAMHEQAMQRLLIEADLRTAIDDKQFRLVYQPIIELNTGELAGFEALIRWDHPQQGIVSPMDFIPIAEDTGLIVEIGKWVLQTAAQQIAHWNRKMLTKPHHQITMNINVSKRQLLNPLFIEDVRECQQIYRLRPQELKLEITESAVVDNQMDIVALLRKLRDLGFPIVMDDFGIGVSSLSTLHSYPIDVLKIDQSFIQALDHDRSLLEIVASITALADNLNITTVAEGIENPDLVGALQAIGCTWGQGYHFSKPLTASAAETYIAEMSHHRRAA